MQFSCGRVASRPNQPANAELLLSRFWANWSDALIIVKPATAIKWHRAGFRRYWTWRSRPRAGRPSVDPEVVALTKRMATANMWGAPWIHAALAAGPYPGLAARAGGPTANTA
jgi:hypothetical protein